MGGVLIAAGLVGHGLDALRESVQRFRQSGNNQKLLSALRAIARHAPEDSSVRQEVARLSAKLGGNLAADAEPLPAPTKPRVSPPAVLPGRTPAPPPRSPKPNAPAQPEGILGKDHDHEAAKLLPGALMMTFFGAIFSCGGIGIVAAVMAILLSSMMSQARKQNAPSSILNTFGFFRIILILAAVVGFLARPYPF